MATYSASAVFNKAANDISMHIFKLSTEMNVPMTIMPFILDKVRADLENEQIMELSNVIIDLTNELEDAKKKLPPKDKTEDKTEGK